MTGLSIDSVSLNCSRDGSQRQTQRQKLRLNLGARSSTAVKWRDFLKALEFSWFRAAVDLALGRWVILSWSLLLVPKDHRNSCLFLEVRWFNKIQHICFCWQKENTGTCQLLVVFAVITISFNHICRWLTAFNLFPIVCSVARAVLAASYPSVLTYKNICSLTVSLSLTFDLHISVCHPKLALWSLESRMHSQDLNHVRCLLQEEVNTGDVYFTQ